MRILFLAQRVPYPPNKGDKLRSFHHIKHLSQRHQISLICLTDDEQELRYRDELMPYCQSVDIVLRSSRMSNLRSLAYLFSSVPLTLPYFYSRQLQQRVQDKLKEHAFDLIFVYCSSMAQYVEQVKDIPRVIDFVDVDSQKWAQYAQRSSFPKKWVYASESHRLGRYEAHLARTYQHCFLVSDREVADFRKQIASCETMTAIFNGVDAQAFRPSPEPYDPHAICFIGDMGYFANLETMFYFSREILPLIQHAVPDVTLYIVGRNPTAELLTFGARHQHIVVTGDVASVQPFVKKSAALVAPMQIARGVQNKILEAMAMGVPVVTNSLGFEGISAAPGQDIFVEDAPEAFAQQVIRLMQEPDLRNTLARNGRQVIEKEYAWENNLDRLEQILQQIVKPSNVG